MIKPHYEGKFVFILLLYCVFTLSGCAHEKPVTMPGEIGWEEAQYIWDWKLKDKNK